MWYIDSEGRAHKYTKHIDTPTGVRLCVITGGVPPSVDQINRDIQTFLNNLKKISEQYPGIDTRNNR